MQTWRPSPEVSTTVTVSASSCSLILASSAFVARESADPAGPGAEAQAANPLILRLLELGEEDQVVVGRVEGWEERADEAWWRAE